MNITTIHISRLVYSCFVVVILWGLDSFAEDRLRYSYTVYNRTLNQTLHNAFKDTSLKPIDREVRYDELVSELTHGPDEAYGVQQRIRTNPSFVNTNDRLIQLVYDLPFDSLPEHCIWYKKSYNQRSTKLLLFEKISNSRINTSMQNLTYGTPIPGRPVFGSTHSDSSMYLLQEGQLLIETIPGKYELIFSLESPLLEEHNTRLGTVVRTNYYTKIEFYGLLFEGVHEYFYSTLFEGENYDFLLWFDGDFNLIRFEGESSGFLTTKAGFHPTK